MKRYPKSQHGHKPYLWEVAGARIAVQLDSAVIDDLLPEVMRAFAAVPKRGAEVGGLLLGMVEPSPSRGRPTLVRVNSFELVPCVYARGPSYFLSAEDSAAFEQALQRRHAEASGHCSVVGYFRSHTRAGLSLSSEDLDLLNRHFPNSDDVALLIRPFATQPSQGGLFFREQGTFQEQTPLVFPFAACESAAETEPEPEAEPAFSSGPERKKYRGSARLFIPLPDEEEEPARSRAPQEKPVARQAEPRSQLEINTAKRRPRSLGRWWLPIAFLLLLVGAAAGFEVSYLLRGRFPIAGRSEFSLALHVVPNGDTLNVRWDPTAPAIRNAHGGVLQIEGDGYSEPVDLDYNDLRNGGILYHRSSASVRFRLTVYEEARVSVTEILNWPR